MADNINLNTFPDGPVAGLTMLYLQNQDLTDVTPEDLLTMYWETYGRIRKANKDHLAEIQAKWFT